MILLFSFFFFSSFLSTIKCSKANCNEFQLFWSSRMANCVWIIKLRNFFLEMYVNVESWQVLLTYRQDLKQNIESIISMWQVFSLLAKVKYRKSCELFNWWFSMFFKSQLGVELRKTLILRLSVKEKLYRFTLFNFRNRGLFLGFITCTSWWSSWIAWNSLKYSPI